MPARSWKNPDRRSVPGIFSVFSKENNYSKIVKNISGDRNFAFSLRFLFWHGNCFLLSQKYFKNVSSGS